MQNCCYFLCDHNNENTVHCSKSVVDFSCMWLRGRYCQAASDVKYSHIEGNGQKFSHIELSNSVSVISNSVDYVANVFYVLANKNPSWSLICKKKSLKNIYLEKWGLAESHHHILYCIFSSSFLCIFASLVPYIIIIMISPIYSI